MAGRTILRDGCDEAEQYRRLYENALAEAEALELRPGVRLSKEQVASLRRDMIWLEEQSLEGTRVLVPRVYLTESTLKGLSMSSANLIAAQIDLKSGELRNRGLIAAESMKLQADGSIVNVAGKLLSSGEMSLLAGQNLIRRDCEWWHAAAGGQANSEFTFEAALCGCTEPHGRPGGASEDRCGWRFDALGRRAN